MVDDMAMVNPGAAGLRGIGAAGLGTGLIAAITMISRNWGTVQTAFTTGWSVKECVMDNKIKTKRDDCLFAFSYLQSNVDALRDMNVSNRNETRESLLALTGQYKSYVLTTQLFDHVNEKTKQIWDNTELSTRGEMQKRVSPLDLDITNIPKSSSEIVSWVTEGASCNEQNNLLRKDLDKTKTEKEYAIDNLNNCRISKESLSERKGECKELEFLKEEVLDLRKLKEKVKELETESRFIKEKNQELSKQNQVLEGVSSEKLLLSGKHQECSTNKDKLEETNKNLIKIIGNLKNEFESLEKTQQDLQKKYDSLEIEKENIAKMHDQCQKWFFQK